MFLLDTIFLVLCFKTTYFFCLIFFVCVLVCILYNRRSLFHFAQVFPESIYIGWINFIEANPKICFFSFVSLWFQDIDKSPLKHSLNNNVYDIIDNIDQARLCITVIIWKQINQQYYFCVTSTFLRLSFKDYFSAAILFPTSNFLCFLMLLFRQTSANLIPVIPLFRIQKVNVAFGLTDWFLCVEWTGFSWVNKIWVI